MEKIFIVDAVNYLFRSYYAIGPMTNNQGQSTSALYGFIRSINKLQREFSPTHLVCVFDGPDNKKHRQEVYSEYKMHRKGAPEDLFPQFELAYDYCEMAGIPALAMENVEADDTMAAIAVWAKKQKAQSFLCTGDKDLCQLVGEDIFVLNVHKDNLLVDAAKVKEMFGVDPDQMLDLLAMMGDKSDNIPGLPGIGPKTAASLLKEFRSLDHILAHTDKLKGKKREIFEKEKDLALMSRELATLKLDVDIPKEESFYELKSDDKEALTAFFHEMKFSSLLKDMQVLPPVRKKVREYQTIDDKHSLLALFHSLQEAKEICIDTETTSTSPLHADIVGIGLSDKAERAFYIPFNGSLEYSFLLQQCRLFFSINHLSFYGHNIKYDMHILKNIGITLSNISFDTILASYLIHPQNRRHNLDQLVLELFQEEKIPIKQLIGEGRKQKSMSEVPIKEIAEYCCEDVDYTIQLKEYFTEKIQEKQLKGIFYDIEVPLIPVLMKMERRGIFLDQKKISEMAEALEERLRTLTQEIHHEAGVSFNLNSPKQLSEVLYQKLGLKSPMRKKSEFSTDAKVLEMLAEENIVASKVLEYRGLEKLRSTYVAALPKQINPSTGRIHPTFNQSVTATGRLSCQDPNLQNIPIRSEEGRKIREGFRPQKEEWVYLSADYSQIELRLLAHLSKDPELIRAFQNEEDIHAYTASLIFQTPIDEVTKEMRSQAKTVNFGILYGQTPYGLSQELGITQKEASLFIETYFQRYPKVKGYLEKYKEEAKTKKMVSTLFGRQRPIPEIDSKNPHIRAAAERLAINTPLQGTAADIIKMAMIHIQNEIESSNLKGFMILQIHDELLFEIPNVEKEIFTELVKKGMEKIIALEVPLTVDISIGKNWAEC